MQQSIKRTILQKFELPNCNYEAVVELAEFAPNAETEPHSHPGPQACYVLEGECISKTEGQSSQSFTVGQSYQLPAGIVHVAGSGDGGLKMVVVWVVEKSKPLRSPSKRPGSDSRG